MHNADFSLPFEVLIGELNHIILNTFTLEKYLTGFFARFTVDTGELEYCDMGHALFFALEGEKLYQVSFRRQRTGRACGEPGTRVPNLRLAPGALLIMSDGIPEQVNRKKAVFPLQDLGAHIHASLASGAGLVSAKVRIFEEFYRFKRDMPQHDDISLLLFHFAR